MVDKNGELEAVIEAAGGNQPVVDDFMETVRSLFEGIDPSATREEFTDYLIGMQTKANESAALKTQLAERETLAAQIAGLKQPEAKESAAAAETKRRWETSRLSDDVKAYSKYMEIDPQSGLYRANEVAKMSPDVQRACDSMNRHLQNQQKFLEDWTSDPYEASKELFQPQMLTYEQNMQKQFDDFKADFESRMKPVTEMTAQQQLDAFTQQHMDILTSKDASGVVEWSPAGDAFRMSLKAGASQEDAIEIAKKIAERTQSAPKMPAVPASKPARGIDLIRKRAQAEGNATVERGGSQFSPAKKFRETFADIRSRIHSEDS